MKTTRRLLAILLAVTLLIPVGIAAPAAKAESTVTGSITATLRIDYAQRLDELARRDLQVELLRGTSSLGKARLYEPGQQTLGAYTAQVSARNADGGDLGGGSWPAALEVTVDGLTQGAYTLKFTGLGYRSYTQSVTLGDYAQHVTLGTGDGTFTLGDVTANGKIDADDRSAYSAVLGSTRAADLVTYDLNGDGAINIVDLAYVDRLMTAQGSAEVVSTARLAPPADLTAIQNAMTAQGTTVQSGELSQLFTANTAPVELKSDADEIVLPLTFQTKVETSELRVVTPQGDGEILSGVIEIEDEGGSVTAHPFDYTPPQGVNAIGELPDAKVITIALGKRVPVKKVTITVTKTAGGEYAAVDSIQFLQDIVPDVPVAPNSMVKTLTAKPGNKSVELSWSELPNVSGYKVLYWPQDKAGEVKELHTDVTHATVTGLDNLQPYDFTVTPTDGSWEGKPSAVVSATPKPSSVPDKVDMLSLKSLDGAIGASWKQGKEATFYRVFYRQQGTANWTQLPGDLITPSATITGLENEKTYEVKVAAWNDVGRGPDSDISECVPKAVKYERPAGIPTSGILDPAKIASVALADPGNYNAGQYTPDAPFTPGNVIDGDYRTHWTAQNWWRNEHIVTTFTEPVDLSAAIWVPRLDGSYPTNLRAYSVQVWYEGEDLNAPGHLLVPDPARGGVDGNGGTAGGDVQTWPSVRGNCAQTNFAILPFGPAQKVTKISVAVEQRGYTLVSCSQLLFVEYDPAHCLPTEIEALFADDLRTTLRPGVSLSDINALQTRLDDPDERGYYVELTAMADELALARELLNNGTSSGVIVSGVQSRSAAGDSAKYSQGGSVLQPLGVAASARQELTVYASGIPEGETVTLYASQFNAEASAWQAQIGTLENGRNLFIVPAIGSRVGNNGGSLYLTYSGANGAAIRLHIRRGVAIPKLELSDWYHRTEAQRKEAIGGYVDALAAYVAATKMGDVQKDYRNVTEISTPVVLLSLPALSVNGALGSGTRADKVDTLYAAIEAWEDLLALCKRTQGIDKVYAENDMQSRQNIRCMTMFAGAFMYAAGNHIGIGYGSCAGMVTGKPISALGENAAANGLFGWGIAHEIGHNMDKLGKAEITNNIYSILAQTWDGEQGTLPSRLEKSGKYASIFTKAAQGYPGASNDVFTQLGMYYQLHLAYDNADPLDFYNRLFKAWKAGTYTAGATSYDDRFALTAAAVANADLTEFFTRWGMTLSAGTKETLSGYPKESRAVWYLSDQSRRERLAGTAAATGTLTARAAKAAGTDNAVTVVIDPTAIQGKLQGFEIRRNGQPIAFVDAAQQVYTDVIGSANHRVFHYEVAAYDILGNRVAETDAGEIRIAYDKTVDPSAYTAQLENGTLTLTFKAETAVSGIKLSGFAPSATQLTVDIAPESGAAAAALTTTLDTAHNQAVDDPTAFVAYFKLPGAAVDDTRIGTYDAKTVTIRGLAGYTADQVRLITYPGDDVAFLEGGTMGRLTADYTYDTLEGTETIPAGTLVIAGTYRGDPVYNTLRVVGRFTGVATTEDGEMVEQEVVERPLAGYALLFAAIPETGPVSDLADGLFLFIPDVQQEAQLQEVSSCNAANLLPSQIRLELYRTDDPNDASSKRLTAQTLWLHSPGGDDLPGIQLTK